MESWAQGDYQILYFLYLLGGNKIQMQTALIKEHSSWNI